MRKLAVGSGAFAVGIIISFFFYDPVLWPVLTGLLLICYLLSSFIKSDIGLYLKYFFLLSSLGFVYFSVYHTAVFHTSANYADSESCTAIVTDYPEEYENCSSIRITLYGKGVRCSALLYDYYNNIAALKPGDRIRFQANLRSVIETESSAADNNLTRGIFLTGRLTSGIELIQSGKPFLSISKFISHAVKNMIPEVFPKDTVSFLQALLLGKKTELYSDNLIYPALLRAGFMHTVAISGMHISFIAGFCLTIFGNNRKGSVLSLALIWIFVFMSGNTPSAARAGIMQTLLLAAPFFHRENDPLTSLLLALALLLIVNPFSAGSISLQLSFAAVLGIILFSARINESLLFAVQNEKLKRLIRYPIGILSSSIGVMVFTIPLSALHFGYVSLLSFLTNLLALWAVPLCFCGAYVCLLLYLILPIAAVFLANILSYLCRYIFGVCSAVSVLPHAVIPYDGFFTFLLFLFIYLFFLIFAFSSFSQVKRLTIPLSFSVVILIAYFLYFRFTTDFTKATVTVLNVGQGECVVAFSGNRSLVIDCGTSDYYFSPGEDCADYLYLRGQKNLDALILTHLHSDHVSGVCQLMELIDVRNIFIPLNADLSDEYFDKIAQTAERKKTKIILVDADSSLKLADMNVELYPSYIYSDGNESCMAIKLSTFGKSFLITGDGVAQNEIYLMGKSSIADINVLVAGHHGANGSSCTAFLKKISPEFAVISVGKGNSYGHPSVYALQRMLSVGITVLRTDVCGRISFIVN